MDDKDEIKIPPVEETHPHLKNFFEFLPELNKESDRGMVLISASYLDELLSTILLAFMVEGSAANALISGFNAPLGTLSTRITAAFALGLITEEERANCDAIRKIRNQFAHHIHISFDDNSLIDLCRNLTLAAQDYGDVVVPPRGRFSTAATALILNLTNRPHYVAQQRLKSRLWPY